LRGRTERSRWAYEDPFDAVREIAGHVAFYAARVDVIVGRLPACTGAGGLYTTASKRGFFVSGT
jgi:hypothetical protein